MQSYMSLGIGFKSSIICSEDWKNLSLIPNIQDFINLDASNTNFSFTIVPFDEDHSLDSCNGWSTIVLKEIKETAMEKSISFETIKKYNQTYFPLSDKHKNEILEVLREFGLQDYIDKVDLIIYPYCC